MSRSVKVVVTVPEGDADKVRQAIGDADGGRIGNYTHCSFSVKGTGRFRPEQGANPAIGEIGKPEEVAEERIEVTCEQDKLQNVVAAIRKVFFGQTNLLYITVVATQTDMPVYNLRIQQLEKRLQYLAFGMQLVQQAQGRQFRSATKDQDIKQPYSMIGSLEFPTNFL